jgi:hypothetical protein
MIRNVVLLCFVAGIAAATGAAAIARLTDDSPSATTIGRGRWMNVTYPLTVRFEAAGDFHEVATYGNTGGYGPPEEFAILSDPDAGGLTVDGRSGRVLKVRYNASDLVETAFIAALRRSLRYDPFTPGDAPWPYAGRPPKSGSEISEPEPLSGIQTSSIMDIPGGSGTLYRNWRSRLVVWSEPGIGAGYYCDVDKADRKAFSHLVAEHVPDGKKATADPSAGALPCVLAP